MFKIAIGFLLLNVSLHLNAEEIPIIEIEQQLLFGTIVIGNDNRVSTITMTADGKTSTTSSALVLTPGQPAIYNVYDFPPFKQLYITVTISTEETSNGSTDSNQFLLKEIYAPKYITTDGNGMASFNVGGTLASIVGNGKRYYDSSYKANYYISVDYD